MIGRLWDISFIDHELIAHIATRLVVLVVLLATASKNLRLRRFKSSRDEMQNRLL